MLASRDRLSRDLRVSRRDGEVDNDLDIWVVENGSHVSRSGNFVLGRLFLGGIGDDVADREHLGVGEIAEVFQICVADSAGADHADANRATHDQRLLGEQEFTTRPMASNRSVSESSNSTTRNASGAASMMSQHRQARRIRPLPACWYRGSRRHPSSAARPPDRPGG